MYLGYCFNVVGLCFSIYFFSKVIFQLDCVLFKVAHYNIFIIFYIFAINIYFLFYYFVIFFFDN